MRSVMAKRTKKKSVLIVEDHDDTRGFMRFLVERQGFTVIEASNGLEAIKAAQAAGPDLVLMDLGMPQLDGLSATKVIRELEGGEQLKIIALTAYGVDDQQAKAAGCDELHFKPLDPKTLEAILNKYLAH
ncbi:MAG TPA: response regulator [Pyrinomonadaceae bacterium]|jgi:CheY-like chemotaxis protein